MNYKEEILAKISGEDTQTPLFQEHFLPWLRYAGKLHRENLKSLLTHTDGENTGLMDLYLQSNFDVPDSVSPAPMTKHTLGEYRARFGSTITIWGGIADTLPPNADFKRVLYIREEIEKV